MRGDSQGYTKLITFRSDTRTYEMLPFMSQQVAVHQIGDLVVILCFVDCSVVVRIKSLNWCK